MKTKHISTLFLFGSRGLSTQPFSTPGHGSHLIPVAVLEILQAIAMLPQAGFVGLAAHRAAIHSGFELVVHHRRCILVVHCIQQCDAVVVEGQALVMLVLASVALLLLQEIDKIVISKKHNASAMGCQSMKRCCRVDGS